MIDRKTMIEEVGRGFIPNHDWSAWTKVVGGYRYHIPELGTIYALSLNNSRRAEKIILELKTGMNGSAKYRVDRVSWTYGLTFVIHEPWEMNVYIAPDVVKGDVYGL